MSDKQQRSVFSLKSTQKAVKAYYDALDKFHEQGVKHEGAVKAAFHALLDDCSQKQDCTLIAEYEMRGRSGNRIRPDAVVMDKFRVPVGYWEAKDSKDNLEQEVRKKFAEGYPAENIIFQQPHRAILYQNGQPVLDADLRDRENLVKAVTAFFTYTPPDQEAWEKAVVEFQQRVPELGRGLRDIIESERKTNQNFVAAFNKFADLCRVSLNPNLRDAAVEEMLIQHLLTERLFRTVFNNADFVHRNVIAQQIELVIDALASRSFSRGEFLQKLDPFYIAIERTAARITEFSEKQKFLNAVYEKFFRGFCVNVADTLGIVYTPPPIVNFMVASVEHLLKEHFGGKTLASEGVHILDPFAGTDNFHVHLLPHIPKTEWRRKYLNEFWTNEIMLLPYYIGCMNIEHTYYEGTGEYLGFPGACLVDTFETAESEQAEFGYAAPENVVRVKKQKEAPVFVVLSNPPYNSNQANENDNNKNRQYPILDKLVRDTYRAASAATKAKYDDPYIKAIRWASNRIRDEGIVALVTNSGFVDDNSGDGIRKCLADDFDVIYILELGGDRRKNPKLSGTTHNVFGIQIGVSINLFIRKKHDGPHKAKIFYARTDEWWRRDQKLEFLNSKKSSANITWEELHPDNRNTWIREGLNNDFDTFAPMGTKASKLKRVGSENSIFRTYSLGVATNRDAWVYAFSFPVLKTRISAAIQAYQSTLDRVKRQQSMSVEEVIDTQDIRIKWTRQLKASLRRRADTVANDAKFRSVLYRPFAKQCLYFDPFWNEEQYKQPQWFPNDHTENTVIAVTDSGSEKPFMALAAALVCDLHFTGAGTGAQCFPFYTHDADGSNRQENVTDWALGNFRQQYKDEQISKRDIFHYVYAVLHHPQYRKRYAANLRRDLPRIPFVKDFWGFAKSGKRLAELHVNYEQQPEFPLTKHEAAGKPLDWNVQKVRLSKDKTTLVYNDFLTLAGIPKEVYGYRLGNRSALEWVIDQYQVSTDPRSGITNDPNRQDEPEYIYRLLGRVITVSLETIKAVNSLPELA